MDPDELNQAPAGAPQDDGGAPQDVAQGAKVVEGVGGQAEAVEQPFNWDDERNPYRYAAMQQQAVLEQMVAAQSQAQFQQAAVDLKARGYTDDQIRESLGVQAAQMQLAQDRARLAEQARPAVAAELSRRIAEEYKVAVDPQELLVSSTGQPIRTPDAMLARADALISERRKATIQQRKEAGADKVDNSGGGTHTLDEGQLSRMSPLTKLRMGLSKMK